MDGSLRIGRLLFALAMSGVGFALASAAGNTPKGHRA